MHATKPKSVESYSSHGSQMSRSVSLSEASRQAKRRTERDIADNLKWSLFAVAGLILVIVLWPFTASKSDTTFCPSSLS